ncbi:MAG: hypothetical protein K8R60_24975 [Burkholderiales bacterium]|nr:hypothetical protein [Burkholderiales bacterium]
MSLPLLDIEFPLRTRAADSASNSGQFIAARLLSAAGRIGIEVEIKSNDRVVGCWSLEVSLPGASSAFAFGAKADLFVCGSIRCDARETGAFLILRQWQVRVSESLALEQLYEALSAAVLERLDSLLGNVWNEAGNLPACVLFLVDDRILERSLLSLDRLQIRLLEDLEGQRAIAGIDLRVAHGRGKGTRPHAGFSSTLRAPPGEMRVEGRALRQGSKRNDVFVRETLSPANMRWHRRASDQGFPSQGASVAP